MSCVDPNEHATPPAVPAAGPCPEPGWGYVLCVAVARLMLVTTLSLTVWSVLPALLGWTPRVIMSGSMEPKIIAGDIVVTRPVPVPTLGKGQIVAVDDPDHPGRTRTHRFLRSDPQGRLVLQGDANAQPDSSHVDPAHLLGVAVLRVPFVGRPAVWLADGDWAELAATGVVAAWCLTTVRPRRRKPLWPARAAVVVSVAAATAGTVAGPADAAFSSTTVAPASNMAAATSFYPYQAAVLTDSPFLFWRLAETSGTTVTDSSGHTRTGTIYTTPTFGQAGPITSEVKDTAIATTASTIAYRTAAAAPPTFSLEAWVATTSTTGGPVIGYGSSSTNATSTTTDRELYLTPGGKAVFGVGTQRTAITSATAVNDGSWHHLVATYTSGTSGMKLYVDGVLSATGTGTPSSTSGYWRAAGEALSNWPSRPTDNFYDGRLDEVTVYSTSLSAARVLAHYRAATS